MNFREYMEESKQVLTEEASPIRAKLKSELGLSNRDVSVTKSYAGSSLSIKVSIKSIKALYKMGQIKSVAQSAEDVSFDERGHEVLAGGNTFVTTSLDWKFNKRLSADVLTKYMDATDGGLELYDEVTLFKTFTIRRDENQFLAVLKSVNLMVPFRTENQLLDGILRVIEKSTDNSLYAKIKV